MKLFNRRRRTRLFKWFWIRIFSIITSFSFSFIVMRPFNCNFDWIWEICSTKRTSRVKNAFQATGSTYHCRTKWQTTDLHCFNCFIANGVINSNIRNYNCQFDAPYNIQTCFYFWKAYLPSKEPPDADASEKFMFRQVCVWSIMCQFILRHN